MFQIVEKKKLNDAVVMVRIAAPLIAKKVLPGQFIIFRLDEFGERVPLTVADYDREGGTITLIFQIAGETTRQFSLLEAGDSILDLVGPLGVPTELPEGTKSVCVIGGGVGVPPLYGLCKKLLAECKEPRVILGFNTAAEVFWQREFEVLGVPLTVTTADGTQGVKGFVTDAMVPLEGKYDYVYACGPEPMLRAVHALCEKQDIHGQFSFEERMACGFGVCMGCSCQTRYGSKRICKDGPVLKREEILW